MNSYLALEAQIIAELVVTTADARLSKTENAHSRHGCFNCVYVDTAWTLPSIERNPFWHVNVACIAWEKKDPQRRTQILTQLFNPRGDVAPLVSLARSIFRRTRPSDYNATHIIDYGRLTISFGALSIQVTA